MVASGSRRVRAVTLFAALIVSSYAREPEARACGGCFQPPPRPLETPSVITDHRMILTISQQESTLWDQIEYSGEPSSFAWVLPISGAVRVGLSADSVFKSLDQLTATTIIGPALDCPTPPPQSSSGCSSTTTVSDLSAVPLAPDAGVVVTSRAVVGPYETVQLKATDANALEAWLAKNGFAIPPDVKPVVDAYVAEKFDFLALRLVPGAGIQDMRPVRVTTPGANAVLPLRMVAAGTGPVIGITLWVVGEGRYEPQNFPSFRIKDEEIVWDWGQSRSNYVELRAQKASAMGGRSWEIESSTNPTPALVRALFPPSDSGASLDYEPDDAASKSAAEVRVEDLAALLAGRALEDTRITRLRADLSHQALASDLVITASQDQSVLARERQAGGEAGQPLCPAYSNGKFIGILPRDQARAYAVREERFSCVAGPGSRSPLWLGGAFAALTIATMRRWRQRRRRRSL
jgi:hypothetical protein